MSIIIHFGSAPSLLRSYSMIPMVPVCIGDTHTVESEPGFENDPGLPMMSADDSCTVDSNVCATSSPDISEKDMTVGVPHQPAGTCFGLPYQDHNYGAPPPPTPPSYSPPLSPVQVGTVETETVSVVTSTLRSEEVSEASITRCVCGFEHDDEYMICCDKCLVWQHVDCMGLDRNKIPETYLCEQCEPRKVDRQKAKLLQAKKKVVLPEKLIFTETSEDSEEDPTNQNSETSKSRAHRNISKKKVDDEKEAKPEPPVLRKGRGSPNKHNKERMEMKRSKLRRRTKSRSDSTCATDEEAQDAWKCSSEWPKKKPESSLDNQYSEEIHSLATSLKNQTDEQKYSQQLQAQLCKVVDFANHKKLVAICDLARDQVIIEFKGQFTSASLFHEKHPAFKHRLFPFVLFYKLRSNEELCVDATNYKCDAKYVRRSCTPNAEVHHFVVSGSLHLYILSIKEIKKDEEITIPFDTNYNLSMPDVTCACDSEMCCIESHTKASDSNEKRKKVKKSHISTDDDSNQSPSSLSSTSSPVKCKNSSTKSSLPVPKINLALSSAPFDGNETKVSSEEQEAEDALKENKKKLTREERKLDAIMRAFDQMEKAAKRRQQALDRMAQQKANSSHKSEEAAEKPESAAQPTVKEEEEKPAATPPAAVVPENVPVEEEKSANNQTVKQKKGKRRRGSGTTSRKRTRTNSGGSDVFTADDTSNISESPAVTSTPSSSMEMPETAIVSASETITPVQQPVISPVFPKTKRFLHHEWLQEKVESTMSAPPPVPLSLHKEVSYSVAISPTCYVRCIKDSPSSGGISAAHLRRSSISGHGKQPSGQGSAKKRWLRQAMYDNEPWEGDSVALEVMNGSVSPLHNACFSPHGQNDSGSPGVSPLDDVVTPLKKRRLMRKSIESLSPPKSPPVEPTGASTWMSPDQSSGEPGSDSLVDNTCSSESSKGIESANAPSSANFVGKCMQTGNGVGKHLLKSLRENWIKNDIKMKSLSSEPPKLLKTHEGSACKAEVHHENKTGNGETSSLSEKASSKTPEQGQTSSEDNQSCVKKNIDAEHSPTSLAQPDVKTAVNEATAENELSEENFHYAKHMSSYAHISDSTANSSAQETGISSTDRGSMNNVKLSKPVMADGPLLCEETSQPQLCSEKPASIGDGGLLKAYENLGECTNANSQLLLPEGLTTGNNCHTPNASYAQANISKKYASRSVCSPVNMSVCHSNVSPVFISSELCGNKVKVLSTETVPTDVKSCCEVERQKESNAVVSEGAENNCNKDSVVFISTTQKRKVSLSEYRQRKRDNPNPSPNTNTGEKKSNNCFLKSSESCDISGESEIKLASLPLFQNTESAVKFEKVKASSGKSPKAKTEAGSNAFETQKADDIPGQRENLTERLKREFGFEEDSDSGIKDGSKCKKAIDSPVKKMSPEIAPILSLCTQLPPPPPPPPSTAIPMVNTNCSTVPPQFNYNSAQPSYVVPQIPASQYMAPPSAMSCQPIIPILPPAPPSSYGGSLARSPYSALNSSQGYMGLPPHIPRLPLPPTYPPPHFQPKVYK